METLRSGDVRAVLRFVGETHALAPAADFRLQTIARLRTLVPAEMTAWVETRAGTSGVEAIASPADPLPDGPRRFARVRDQHPLLRHFERSRRGGAVKLSDFLGSAQLRQAPLYQEFFRPAGFDHQMAIALPSRGAPLVRITLNRARGDFSERDRLVLNLIRPHLLSAHRAAVELESIGAQRGALEHAAEASNLGVVLVRGSARVAYANACARRQLATFLRPQPAGLERLPRELAAWLAPSSRAPLRDALPVVQQPLVIVREAGRRLEVRALRDGDQHVLMLREHDGRLTPRSLEGLGLTRRQAEILVWIAQGKTNPEIAAILSLSPSTVARHVEAIFERLDVRTRTAAASAAFTHLASR